MRFSSLRWKRALLPGTTGSLVCWNRCRNRHRRTSKIYDSGDTCMVLTKNELINSLRDEVRILLHLASKADPAKLDYRPTPKQRSTIELLRYLTMVGPIHLRAVLNGGFDMDAW